MDRHTMKVNPVTEVEIDEDGVCFTQECYYEPDDIVSISHKEMARIIEFYNSHTAR